MQVLKLYFLQKYTFFSKCTVCGLLDLKNSKNGNFSHAYVIFLSYFCCMQMCNQSHVKSTYLQIKNIITMKNLTMIAIVAVAMAFAACGNQGSNTDGGKGKNETKADGKVAYETFTVEKYGASFDLPKGMRRTDNPQMGDGGVWTFVPEDYFFAVDAAVEFGVHESMWGEYDDEKIQREFDEDIPAEAVKKLDLAKKEYTYSVGEDIKEVHRVVFKGDKYIHVMVSYTDEYASKLGGEVCDHILNSAKFN